MNNFERVAIPFRGGGVSGLLEVPEEAFACYVMAHGAGAGMEHPFMGKMAELLAARRVATLRFQFPYMENRSNRPDPPAIAQACVRGAVQYARTRLPELPIFVGGKSFGGRMSSQAEAEESMTEAGGLIFLGFPLHPAGKASIARAAHLSKVRKPMLFLQGTRDALAEMHLLKPVIEGLGKLATLKVFEEADHSFHAPKRTGLTDEQRMEQIADAIAEWMRGVLG